MEAYSYYPGQWTEPYLSRRRKIGWDLYELLGLTRDDQADMAAQHGRNFPFFDAPVGLIFTTWSCVPWPWDMPTRTASKYACHDAGARGGFRTVSGIKAYTDKPSC